MLNLYRRNKLKREYKFTSTLRLTDSQRKRLSVALIKINKDLIGKDFIPMKETEILHQIINIGIETMRISSEGTLEIGKE